MGKKKRDGTIPVGALRPFMVYPVLVGWKILPIELKRQVGTIEQFALYKNIFAPGDAVEEPMEEKEELDG